jgi:ABC-2 type transport system ATP-binding protein
VLLSSHLLHEIQIIADDLIVIGLGRIVAHGPKEELMKGSRVGTFVRATDGPALAAALEAAGINATVEGDGFYVEAPAEKVAKTAADASIVLVEIRESSAGGLEEMFLELTSPTQRDALPSYGVSS